MTRKKAFGGHMELFPAIDLFGGKAVRLVHGDYAQMPVYHDNPLAVAADFIACGARPVFGFVARGRTHKVGIRAGGEEGLSNYDLPYTFYVSTAIPAADANRMAARLGELLYNPVSLLLPTCSSTRLSSGWKITITANIPTCTMFSSKKLSERIFTKSLIITAKSRNTTPMASLPARRSRMNTNT
jgi:hypothetical protein